MGQGPGPPVFFPISSPQIPNEGIAACAWRITKNGQNVTATQNLLLNVNEAPKITSATMFVGMPGMFAVTAAGSPGVSNHIVSANPQ